MNKINTNINAVGSIPEYDMIYYVLQLLAKDTDSGQLYEKLVLNNKFGIRTEQSRARFLRAIQSAFWEFKNKDHEILISTLFKARNLEDTKRYALFWSMGINNLLFEKITNHVFFKAYFSGRVQIANHDITAYLRHERESSEVIKKWSDTTLTALASKYLTFLKKIDFVKGRLKREFRYIQLDNISLVFLVYLIKAIEPGNSNIMESRYFNFFLLKNQAW